jgi:hypothetical protein
MLVAIFGEMIYPSLIVAGNPTATADQIAAAELTYRVGILLGFLIHLVFIVLVASLYELLHAVDRERALLMVLFVAIGIAVALANMVLRFTPLVLLDGAEYRSVFTKAQLDVLALSSLQTRSGGAAFPMAVWGLWLFPFGILVARSRFLPRILGILLLVAGFGYCATSVVAIGWPEQRELFGRILMPLYVCEVPIVFWLLIKGAKVPAAA